MKVTHVSTYDINGGAARAAYRLHSSLLKRGINSNMLVMKKESDLNSVYSYKDGNIEKYLNSNLRKVIERGHFRKYKNRTNKIFFSYGNIGFNIANHKLIEESDVIHFHWINDSFINIDSLVQLKNKNKKIVFTLHDMWLFTGGCHYSSGCDKYKFECGNCPILESKKKNDISNKIFKYKTKIINNIDFNVITCSEWLNKCAQESILLKGKNIDTIPNVLSRDIFKKIDKKTARNILGLKENKTYVAFGAVNSTSDPRKGFKFLLEALKVIKSNENKNEVELLVFGASNCKDDLPFKSTFLGRVYDEYTLALIYNSADVFVAPSIEDNLPNTVLESIYCNTPVVAFDIGGMKDMIKHKQNGYLAKPNNYNDLANGIEYVLEKCKDMNNFIEENLEYDTVINKILKIYE